MEIKDYDYKVLAHENVEQLAIIIRTLLFAGYKIAGGVCVYNDGDSYSSKTIYAQAMYFDGK